MSSRSRQCLAAVTILVATVFVSAEPAATAAGAPARARVVLASRSCEGGAPTGLAYPAGVQQVITVDASKSASKAFLSIWQRSARCFARVEGPFLAFVGRSGLSRHKREGDGATPVGVFAIGAMMFGVLANPGLAYPYHRIVCGDWWDEDPRSSGYNRLLHLGCGQPPAFAGGSEALWRITPAYDYFAVISYNDSPTIPGRGSAIFLHVSTAGPTAGCVSLPAPELLRVLRWLRPADHPEIALSLAGS